MFLLVLDAHLKWPEVVDMGTSTKAPRVIAEYKKLFARFGLLKLVVTDCGTQYTSEEFKSFLSRNDVKQSFSPPHHPATNGAAENFIGTFKDKVDKIIKSGRDLNYAINLFLHNYRSREHCTTGRSPTWLMYKREIRKQDSIS